MIEATGHRGAKKIITENTIESFQYAIDIGCNYIELDVHLTKDGKHAVMHDEDISRMTNGTGLISNYSMEELKEFTVGEKGKIPEINEVFDLIKNENIKLQIELKGAGTEKSMPEIIKKHNMIDRVLFTSFWHKRILYVNEHYDCFETGLLVSANPVDPVGLLETAGADNLHVHYECINEELVYSLHKAGKKIVAWGIILEEKVINRLIDLKVDKIGSDDPDLLIKCLRNKGEIV